MGQVSEPYSARDEPLGFGNELATQFDKPLCEYAIITSNGIETVRRRRLVDIFASIVKLGGGAEGAEGDIRKLAKQYGLAETSATALAVACGQGSDVGPDSRIAKVTDPEVLDFARRVFIEFGGKAHLTESATVEGLSVENVRASPRHDGIATYVARLVRSIWNTPIIKEVLTPTGPVLTSTHKVTKLQEIQRSLAQLQEFLESNKSFIEGLAGPEALGRASSRQEEVELQGENRALTSLLSLVNNIVEGISFVLVLFEERLEDILALLPEQEAQARVRQLTFQGLFSIKEGKDLARELVKAIVNRNITKGSNVETVAEALRRKCGSFCSSDDVIIFKAQENLKKAADSGANAERGRILLNDSLRLFEQVAKSLSYENLTTTVSKYIELEFYAGMLSRRPFKKHVLTRLQAPFVLRLKWLKNQIEAIRPCRGSAIRVMPAPIRTMREDSILTGAPCATRLFVRSSKPLTRHPAAKDLFPKASCRRSPAANTKHMIRSTTPTMKSSRTTCTTGTCRRAGRKDSSKSTHRSSLTTFDRAPRKILRMPISCGVTMPITTTT